ncbi:hypothetical protein DPQ31_28760 [Bacillus sp. COPE52]|nr:hypothetical protein DPQ31_28760 [Bacillus sp. COPE52]
MPILLKSKDCKSGVFCYIILLITQILNWFEVVYMKYPELVPGQYVKVTTDTCEDFKKGEYVQFIEEDYLGIPDVHPIYRCLFTFENHEKKRAQLYCNEFEINDVRIARVKRIN